MRKDIKEIIKHVAFGSFLTICVALAYTLYFDFDHFWWIFDIEEIFTITGVYGRPLHHIVKVVLDGMCLPYGIVAFNRRLYAYLFGDHIELEKEESKDDVTSFDSKHHEYHIPYS